MAYQTLYRKYRPNSFELVYGQDAIVKTLKNIVKNDRLSHAYLFTGPRGTGKTSSAKLFAKAINCLNPINGDACNECENCKSFNENSNPDIIEMDAASNNGVDEIREIKNKVNLVPSMSKYKVYIIDEVHMLSIGAFNALLKTLEEPPSYVIFILATTDPQKIPPTIISRCQRYDFKSISKENMKKCLNNIIKKENISIEEDALDEIIINSNGGMRDAIGLLDQSSSFCESNITSKDIEDLSGNISNNEITTFLKSVVNIDYSDIYNKINEYSLNGKDFNLICEKLINFIRNILLYKKRVIELPKEITKIFENLEENKIYNIIDMLSILSTDLKKTYQKELIFEVKMIQLMDYLKESSEEKVNVSRETLNTAKKQEKNVDTNEKENKEDNVPCETLEENSNLNELKNIRINNILKDATKENINFITELWNNVENYLTDDNYKISAGILVNAKPVAASNKGVRITLPLDSAVNRIESKYDNSKDLLEKILNQKYKIVYISSEYWKKIRPEFAKKVKEGTIEYIDENKMLNKIRETNNFVDEFNDLIEMEEK